MSRISATVALIIYLLVAAGPSQAADILVIGDSWGVAAGPALQKVLIDNGSAGTVASIAEGGETAENINTPQWLAKITAALEENPDASLVHLSLGGNDFLGQWNAFIGKEQEDQLIADVIEDISSIVDHILGQRPEIRIFWSSYDYPRPLIIGSPEEVNKASMRFSVEAQTLAESKGDSLSYGDFNGLTQVVYGFDGVQTSPFDPDFVIPPGDPSLPDPQYPGPAAAYLDAIHLTPEAYLVLAQSQYQDFYQAVLGFQINAGLNDAWYDPATAGQGFLIAVFPEISQMFVAWFTFDTERPPEDVTAMLGDPGHRWLTAQGPYDGNTANLTIYVTEGGVFDAAEPPASLDPAGDGTLKLEFADCSEGMVRYEITSLGISGDIPIQRIVPDNVPLCEALADP
jgi:hypothetical protein